MRNLTTSELQWVAGGDGSNPNPGGLAGGDCTCPPTQIQTGPINIFSGNRIASPDTASGNKIDVKVTINAPTDKPNDGAISLGNSEVPFGAIAGNL